MQDYDAVVAECTSAMELADTPQLKFAMHCTRSYAQTQAGRPAEGMEDAHAAITIFAEAPEGCARGGTGGGTEGGIEGVPRGGGALGSVCSSAARRPNAGGVLAGFAPAPCEGFEVSPLRGWGG